MVTLLEDYVNLKRGHCDTPFPPKILLNIKTKHWNSGKGHPISLKIFSNGSLLNRHAYCIDIVCSPLYKKSLITSQILF